MKRVLVSLIVLVTVGTSCPNPPRILCGTDDVETGWLQLVDMRGEEVITAPSFERVRPIIRGLGFWNGYIIKLLAPRELIILGFGQGRDKTRAKEAPGDYLRVSGAHLTENDYTGHVCLKGAVLRVSEVNIGKPIGGVRTIWVRVVPP